MTKQAESLPEDIREFPEFMTIPQVADVFQVTTQTVRNWCKEGKFAGAVRPGKSWRIPKATVLQMLNDQYG